MRWYELILMIPLGLIGFIASIMVPISLQKLMHKGLEKLEKENEVKLENFKSIADNIFIFVYFFMIFVASIYFS